MSSRRPRAILGGGDAPAKRRRVLLYDEALPAPRPPPASLEDASDRLTRKTPDGLSVREMEFCILAANGNPTAAAAEVFKLYGPRAWIKARELKADPRIDRQIQLLIADRLKRKSIDADEHFGRLWAERTARTTEAVELWVPPCRYCWGENFEYQRTLAEFEEDFEAWMRLPDVRTSRQRRVISMSFGETLVYNDDAGKLPFDQKGGWGYNSEAEPNKECPNCFGRGLEIPGHGTVPYVRLKDTRTMSLEGQLLFAGVKRGPHGPEIQLRDQAQPTAQLNNIFSKWMELRAAGGVPTGNGRVQIGLQPPIADLLSPDDPKAMSDAQLDALLTTHGIVITPDEDGQSGEGTDSGADSGEAPPPGYIA